MISAELFMKKPKVPTRTFYGRKKLPYFEIVYEGGSICDISGKPRRTAVLFFCDPLGQSIIDSIDEVSSCEYEMIVFTPRLCKHPDYK